MHSLCWAFQALAARTWDRMYLSASTKILLREDGITALNLQDLVHHHPSDILIQDFTPFEESSTTGADWEWWVFGDDGVYGAAVQAKRLLTDHYDTGYVPKNGTPQIERLLDYCSANNIYPMYCFYNWWPVADIPEQWACGSTPVPAQLLGCTLADGWGVNFFYEHNVFSDVSLALVSEPWSSMVCGGDVEDPAQRALEVSLRLGRAADQIAVEAKVPDRRRREPVIHERLPDYVKEAWTLASSGRRREAAERMGEYGPKRIVLSGKVPPEFRRDRRSEG